MKKKIFFVSLMCLFVVSSLISQNQQWVVYTPSNSGLPDHWIHAIAIESNGTKWFGTENGIAKLSGNNWTAYNNSSNPNLPYPPIVTAIAVDAYGNKWFGLGIDGLVKFDGTNWTFVFNQLVSLRINCLIFDATGRLWVGTNYGLAIINDGNITIYNTSNSMLPNEQINDIAFDSNGNAWLATDGGLIRYDGNNWIVYNTSNSLLPDNYIRCIAIDANGTKWLGTFFVGLVKFDGTNWTVYNSSNSGLPYNRINCITIDAQGNKWIGTEGGGLVKYNGTSWAVFDYSNSYLENLEIRSLKIDSYGNKWIGTMAGVAVYNENGVSYENAIFTDENNAIIYPSPVKDIASIYFSTSALKKDDFVDIVVFDLTGKELIRQQLQVDQNADGRTVAKLNCSFLNKGVYLCEVRSKRYLIAKQKLVKD